MVFSVHPLSPLNQTAQRCPKVLPSLLAAYSATNVFASRVYHASATSMTRGALSFAQSRERSRQGKQQQQFKQTTVWITSVEAISGDPFVRKTP